MKLTTSCESTTSNASISNGSRSAGATRTSASGTAARAASMERLRRIDAGHAIAAESTRELEQQHARAAADIEGSVTGCDARGVRMRSRQRRAVAADVPSVGIRAGVEADRAIVS